MRKTNFFNHGSPYLTHPLLTPQRTKAEIDFVLAIISLPEGGLVLDIGCGFGRHSIELAQRGYSVVGIDPSEAMIGAAREACAGMENPPLFVQAYTEEFKSDQRYDAGICLFTTLGQIEVEQDNRGLVARASHLLKPGAQFILELPHLEWVVNNLKSREKFQSEKETTLVERAYNPEQHTITEVFTVLTPKEQRDYVLRYRLFKVKEIEQLLNGAGLTAIGTYAGYQDRPLETDSPTLVMLAVKK